MINKEVIESHLVDFEKVEWQEAGRGIRYKKVEKEGKILRLMELTPEYVENEWCMHGHIAVILCGMFKVEFKTHTEIFHQGDVVWIPGGETHQHKASVDSGERMQMLSFEL